MRPRLATKQEIEDKFDGEMATIILEERKIVFWFYGIPIGAFIGAATAIISTYVWFVV